jgi:hypothetical protein
MSDSLSSFVYGLIAGVAFTTGVTISVLHLCRENISLHQRPGRPNIAISDCSGHPTIEVFPGSGRYVDVRTFLETIKDKDQRAISNATIKAWAAEYRRGY